MAILHAKSRDFLFSEHLKSTLFLIREELKARKVFNTLEQLGMEGCYFQPHLDHLILECIGLDAHCDETFNKYNQIMDRRSKKLEACHESISNQAIKALHEILNLNPKRPQ